MFLSFLLPLFFIFFSSFSWCVYFKKTFEESLAPSMMMQSIIVLLTGLYLNNLCVGILFGLLINGVLFILACRESNQSSDISFSAYCKQSLGRVIDGVICFLIFYIFIYLVNIGKRFLYWDEYMHWGFFLKECLRLNALYCTSPIIFHHKDYVPMVTIFEYIYCVISGGQVESDAYRAIQIMSYSMIVYPICCKEMIRDKWKGIFVACLLIFIPFMFVQDNGFKLYHSVYIDYILGLIVFYSIMIALKNEEKTKYQVFILVLSCTFLALSKMIAIVFVPAIFAFYVVKRMITVQQGNALLKLSQLLFFVPIIIPIAFWWIFNQYVNKYIDSIGNIQSYKGLNLCKILDSFWGSAASSIPYIPIVRDNYIRALFTRDILLHGSYVVIVLFLVILLGFVSFKQWDKMFFLTSFWIFLTAIYYALVMYILYLIAFSEREATILASYERYMNTFVVAAVYITIVSLLQILTDNKYVFYFKGFVLVYILFISFGHITSIDQLIPGSMMKDYEKIQMFEERGENIISHTDNNSKILVAYSGKELKDYRNFIELRYFCYPRIIEGTNGGISVNDFLDKLRQCDYLYVSEVDEDYFVQYKEVFVGAKYIFNNSLYRIVVDNEGSISLEYLY